MTASADPRDTLVVDLTPVLDALPAIEHEVIELVYFQGRTFRETAGLLAMDERAVSRTLSVAFGPLARIVLDH